MICHPFSCKRGLFPQKASSGLHLGEWFQCPGQGWMGFWAGIFPWEGGDGFPDLLWLPLDPQGQVGHWGQWEVSLPWQGGSGWI